MVRKLRWKTHYNADAANAPKRFDLNYRPVIACGARGKRIATTENPYAVTCKRCREKTRELRPVGEFQW